MNVEVFVGGGEPRSLIVGLPDKAVREANQRVQAAIQASGWSFPGRRVIVNLAPADVPKAGSAYDLPIALGVLAASKAIPPGGSGSGSAAVSTGACPELAGV